MKYHWKKVKQLGGAILKVLVVDNQEMGFIFHPKDTKTDKNAWRIHKGIGFANQFICHKWTEKEAKDQLKFLIFSEK